MKKTYKDFEAIYIGSSDGASLMFNGNLVEGAILDLRNKLLAAVGAEDITDLYLKNAPTNSAALSLAVDITFGEDGDYKAYMVTEKDVEIGAHYKHSCTFKGWLTIYDDDSCVKMIYADTIKVFRAGDFGCIIQAYNNDASKAPRILIPDY